MDDFSPGLESLFEGVDLPFNTPGASAYIKQRDSPVFSSPGTSTSSNSAYPSPDTSSMPSSSNYSPKLKLTVEKWDAYHPTTRLYFPLFDQNYQVYEMDVRTKIDKLANINSDNYSSVDDAYILYRQNQFELEVTVPSLPSQLFIQNNTSFVAVDSFHFHIYAVKQTRKDDTGIPIVDNEDVAELIQHLSAREKKEVQVPPPMPIVNGQVVFSRLQFKSATLNNARTNPDQPHPNQQYFRLVLSLIVKIEDTFHFIMSRISPRLILRGRNPGNFNHSPSHEVPTPSLSIEQPPQHSSSRQTKRQRVPQQQQQQQLSQQTPTQQLPQQQTQQQTQQQSQQQAQLQSEQLLQQQMQSQLAAMQQPMRMAQQPQVHTQRHIQLQLQQEMLQQQEMLKQQELQNFLLQQQLESELNPQLHPPPLMSAPNTTTTTTTTSVTVMQPLVAPQPTYPTQSHPLQVSPPPQAIPTHLQAPIHPKREQDHDIQQQPLLQISQSQVFESSSSSQQPSQQPQQQQQQNPRKSQKRNYLDAKMNAMQDPKDSADDGWQMDSRGNIYLSGKVGINTLPTEEALTVHGNVLVTGNYLKPSDERVKTNIRALDGKAQLENIERLQLYEYDLRHEKDKDGANLHETGVLAQELRKVLPQAVQVLQNVTLSDGTIMPELLVVQDRALLYENIGATKQLGAEVRKNQANLTALQKRSQELKAVTNRAFAAVGRSLDYLLTETGDDYNRDDIKAKWCYCTLFGLGPAWTIYFLGFILPPLWLCGIFYISSFQHVKKLAGFFSAISLCLYIAFVALIFSMEVPPATMVAAPVSVAALGLVLLFGPIAMSWGHKKRRRKYYKFTKKKVHKARLRQELGVVNEALQEDDEGATV